MARINYKVGEIIGSKGLIYIAEWYPLKLPCGQTNRVCIFKCTCGHKFKARLKSVKRGNISNCGCGAVSNRQKHNLTGHRLRRSWAQIKNRCFNPKVKAYSNYGGRGITMYEPWIHNFKAFYDYVTNLPKYGEPFLTLDRIENDENYEPGNLRWATRYEQVHNSRKFL